MKKLSVLLLGVAIGFAMCYFYFNQQNDLKTIVKPPKGLITVSQAKTLDQAFNNRHQLISDSIVKRPDNRSSWYSLRDMRAYLDYAEKQADTLKYTMDGIRVYLGAYPTAKEVGYTTMFFVPTGIPNKSQGHMFNINFQKSNDIPGGNGLNGGDSGYPPNANYPQ